MLFTRSTLISALIIIGATAVPCSPTPPTNPPPVNGGDCNGDQTTQCNTCVKENASLPPVVGSLLNLPINIPILGNLANHNCLSLPGLAGNSCNGNTKICCPNNGGKCIVNNGLLAGSNLNVCVLGGILGPCTAST